MICFEVSVNGEKVATAGLPGAAILSNIITWVHRRGEAAGTIAVTLGGLDSNREPGDHVHWLDTTLKLGDEVVVRIVEDVPVDAPTSRYSEKQAETDRPGLLRRELAFLEKRRKQLEKKLKQLDDATNGGTARGKGGPARGRSRAAPKASRKP